MEYDYSNKNSNSRSTQNDDDSISLPSTAERQEIQEKFTSAEVKNFSQYMNQKITKLYLSEYISEKLYRCEEILGKEQLTKKEAIAEYVAALYKEMNDYGVSDSFREELLETVKSFGKIYAEAVDSFLVKKTSECQEEILRNIKGALDMVRNSPHYETKDFCMVDSEIDALIKGVRSDNQILQELVKNSERVSERTKLLRNGSFDPDSLSFISKAGLDSEAKDVFLKAYNFCIDLRAINNDLSERYITGTSKYSAALILKALETMKDYTFEFLAESEDRYFPSDR